MPYITLEDQTRLYYETHGSGTPILFIHGVLMSGQFFHKQFSALSANYQCIRLDLRGHGESDKTLHGHTISQYARDVREFLKVMELDQAVLAGWSMGAFVVWDYFNQFGNDNIQAAVIIDQSASDYQWEGWEHGPFDFDGLKTAMHAIQTDPLPFYESFIHNMFAEPPAETETEWMLAEILKQPAAISSTILFNQTAADYRGILQNINVPTLLCFGEDRKFFSTAAGEHLRSNIPNSTLVTFSKSSHCPFLEEPDAFNSTLLSFLVGLIGKP
ncbi:alpha/beta hydrolase [Bacillus spizizenii]|uniref:alpha/beta fold hydrolase n=1 Tax=Bacillus spizizenii TaxID=96241 RepID=UPI0005CB6535|nr:alpha/beta hydrolase [Bacillus spizizenii]MCY8043452.1 alpha/beta hydrolase [Bacillus spizizenii]MCY8330553.1 alpha/beta hydrolase [Bacillus spizizenii]